MIKYLYVALAAACLANAADAADLSMTPIYKSRPSDAASLDGRLKAEYQSFNFISPGHLDRPAANANAGTIAKLRAPMADSPAQTGTGDRF